MFLVKISAIDFLFLIFHGLAASKTCTPKKKKKKTQWVTDTVGPEFPESHLCVFIDRDCEVPADKDSGAFLVALNLS